MRTNPPAWAEAVLRLFLAPDTFMTVSGDLLEQYRDTIVPTRGSFRADCWYLAQALGFAMRKVLPWAVLFAVAFVARSAVDMLFPTTDFHGRSEASTYSAIALLLSAGIWSSWRSGSFLSGAAAGFATTAVASLLSIFGVALLLLILHDERTMNAIAASGGIGEDFSLPVMIIVPGVILGGVGGLIGAAANRLTRAA